MKTLTDLGVSTDNHAVRKAELESARRVRQGAHRGATFLRFVGLPLLLLVVVVSAVHAVSFFTGEKVDEGLKQLVSLGNIIAIDALLVYLVVAEATLRLVGLDKKGHQVVYLRSLVAFLNASVLLVEFGHLAGWMAYLVPWAGSITVVLFLPFFFVAVPAVEDVRGRLNEAQSKLDEELAAVKGALDTAVDPELVAARERVDDLELLVTQAEADGKAMVARHREREAELQRALGEHIAVAHALTEEKLALIRELDETRATNAAEQAEMRRLLAEAQETTRDLIEKLAQAGAERPAALPAKAARKPVEATCDGCDSTIVGFGDVGTARREAPKHGGKVLCKACRDAAAKEAA